MTDKGDDISVDKELIKSGTELIKLAYTDAFQPPAKEVGKALGTVGKAVNVGLAPLRGVVWSFEKIESFIVSKVSEKLEKRGVNEEDIVTPDPDIAVPTIEALRFSKLKNEYANLLASSMDKKSLGVVHPSYTEILRQLTPDEVKILNYINNPKAVYSVKVPFITLKRMMKESGGEITLGKQFGSLANNAKLDIPHKMEKYIDNLERLGIIHIPFGTHLTQDKRYSDVLNQEYVKTHLAGENHSFDKSFFEVTALGRDFMKSCID